MEQTFNNFLQCRVEGVTHSCTKGKLAQEIGRSRNLTNGRKKRIIRSEMKRARRDNCWKF
jgi:hypothetical protein